MDYERQRRSVSDDAINKLQLALEAAGITFINANGEGEGVRLRTPKR